jgi:hypothetical protein
MQTVPPRKFSLADAMVLIAAIALGFCLVRLTSPPGSDIWSSLSMAKGGMSTFVMIQNAGQLVGPFLVTLTFALLMLRLRRPRPHLRRVLSQPGSTACIAATIAIVVEIVWIGSLLAVGSRFIHLSTVFVSYAQQVSFAVLGGWTVLAVSGRWRNDPSWIDRAGRVMGMAWIVMTAIHFGGYFLVV